MKEDFVSHEIAVKLKGKGFGEPTMTYYQDGKIGWSDGFCYFNSTGRLSDPTISQVLKWLREEKNLFVSPNLYKKGYEPYIQSTIYEDCKDYTDMWRVSRFYTSYEEAALAGVNYCLDNLI